jgi:putative nucleotidyltransferase with HDIG domain
MLPESLRVAEVVCALSQALDLGTGTSRWHSVRTCIVGMRIAAELKLRESVRCHLYYALLLKDASSSGHTLVEYLERDKSPVRGRQSYALADLIGLPSESMEGVSQLYERWDGRGNVQHHHGNQIPISARIMLVAQTLDVLCEHTGPDAALSLLTQEEGTWFDPQVVKAAKSLASRKKLWPEFAHDDLPRMAWDLEPVPRTMGGGTITLATVCRAFGSIVDARSPFTYNHSTRVAHAATTVARQMDLPESSVTSLGHAALLHDLGKMALSDSILHKNGQLDASEWVEMRKHPEDTYRILNSIRGFETISDIAASHHERLDGSGYFRGLTAEQLPVESRILAVADVFEALSSRRPYREALPLEKVFEMIREATPHAYDPDCLEGLQQSADELIVSSDQSPSAIALPARSSG